MSRLFDACVAVATISLVMAPVFAHGGQYRGPADVKPPASPGPGSSTTSSSSGSSGGGAATTSGTAGSGTSSTAGPAGPAAIGGRARGASLDDDLGRWEFWWEFGKDPYLRLREAVYENAAGRQLDDALLDRRLERSWRRNVRPTDADLQQVTEALLGTLRQVSDRDTISATMIALAKIGRDGPNLRLHDAFLPFLASGDQEQRETAALALGIADIHHQDSIDLLRSLVDDDPRARRASGGSAANERTRAFAAFGLGLQLRGLQQAAASRNIVDTLLAVIADPDQHGRNLKVAAIEALSLFPVDWRTAAGNTLRESIVRALDSYYQQSRGPGEELVQAHVPPAIAHLVGRSGASAAAFKLEFAEDLRGGLVDSQAGSPRQKVNPHISQSCALALGSLLQPWNADTDPDAGNGKLLLEIYHHHRDQQTRSFALLSLAKQGGSAARSALLRETEKAGQAIEKPWCAMALGVFAARSAAASATRSCDDEILKALLREEFVAARNPSTLGALAIALGLAGDVDATDTLLASLHDNRQRDDIAGYVSLALGLIGEPRACADIREVRDGAERRPFLQMQCVRALGLLDDHTLFGQLCDELQRGDQSLAQLAAISSALGQIGDRRSIAPLLELLNRGDVPQLGRAFAAVALGIVCDKSPLPWNAAYATSVNYRASTETLTDGAAGILDIL